MDINVYLLLLELPFWIQDLLISTCLYRHNPFITLYPNFCMPLQDPHLLTTLKVQIQTVGATQARTTYATTLYYQMVYRVRNHAIDLTVPNETDEALLINIDSTLAPSSVHIPRQISRQVLMNLLLETWVANYVQRHQQPTPIQSTDSIFSKNSQAQAKITFKKSNDQEHVQSSVFKYVLGLKVVLLLENVVQASLHWAYVRPCLESFGDRKSVV